MVSDAPSLICPSEFRLLQRLFKTYSGLVFSGDALPVFDRCLRPRIAILGLHDFMDYYRYLTIHPRRQQELEWAVSALTTHETYFFRQTPQLYSFRDEVLPTIHKRGEHEGWKGLTVWSAGCSTGEEAYTLAMLIDETELFRAWEVSVFGTDISRNVVRRARDASYRRGSFRTFPDRYRSYFVPSADGFRVREDIRDMCRFGQLNLLEHDRAAVVGRCDVIFCRNVLIYLDFEARRRVIDMFYERLNEGGYLFLGHSESLLNVSTAFELCHLTGDLAYRKPLAATLQMEKA